MSGKMEIIRAGRRLAERGLAPGTSGNLSARIDEDQFLITRRGAALADLTLDDIIEMKTLGTVRGDGVPSSEWRLHAEIYRETRYRAVLHCHPARIIAVTMECERWTPPTREGAYHFPEVRVVEHQGPNMLDPRPAVEYLKKFGVVVLRAHGLVMAGERLLPLVPLAESLEEAARVALYLRSVVFQ